MASSPSTAALAIQSLPAPSVSVAPSTTTPISSVRPSVQAEPPLVSLGSPADCGGGGSVRQEVARRDHRQNRDDARNHQQVRREPDAEPRQAGADQGPQERAAAEGGMELRHDGAPELVFHVGAFDVLGHVPEPDPHTEEEQCDAGPGNGLRQQRQCHTDACHGGDEAGGPDGIRCPDAAHHVAGGGQGDQGARRHTQQQGSHLPGRDVQDVRHRGDPGGPTGEHQPVDPENQERRRSSGIELRAGCRLCHTITASTECWASWASSSELKCLSVTRTSTEARAATSATALASHLLRSRRRSPGRRIPVRRA